MSALVPRVTAPDRCPARVYLASLAPSGRRTQATALRVVAGLLAPGVAPERLPWEALRFQHVAAVRARLLERGYAPATVNRVLAALRGVARAAWRLGLMPLEECARVREVQRAKGLRLPAGRMLTPEELRALIAACGPRERAAVALLYGAGLRVSEACAVEPEHLDLEARTVRVVGKGNVEALAPLPPGMAGLLLEWLVVRPPGPGPVLVREGGGRLHPNSLASALRKASERAGLRPCSPHDLRRTFVSALLDSGADLATVQRLARHEDPRTTSRYDRRPASRAADAVGRIDL